MRNLLVILLTVFSLSFGFSQSEFGTINTGNSEVGTEQISTANPYWGFNLLYNLDESKPLDESFVFSAKLLKVLASGERFSVPLVGEVGLGDDDILSPGSGINAGIYPYYVLSQTSQFKILAHGGVGLKIIEEGVGVGEDAPQQIRLVAGFEGIFTFEEGGNPFTLSVTPVYLFNSNSVVGNTGALEITAVLPVGANVGLLAEGLVPFQNGDFESGFRFGVIARGQL